MWRPAQPPELYSDQIARWAEWSRGRGPRARPHGSPACSGCQSRGAVLLLWSPSCRGRRAPHRVGSQPLPLACFENSVGSDLRAPRPVLSLLICLTLAANCRFLLPSRARTLRLLAASCGGGRDGFGFLVALPPHPPPPPPTPGVVAYSEFLS